MINSANRISQDREDELKQIAQEFIQAIKINENPSINAKLFNSMLKHGASIYAEDKSIIGTIANVIFTVFSVISFSIINPSLIHNLRKIGFSGNLQEQAFFAVEVMKDPAIWNAINKENIRPQVVAAIEKVIDARMVKDFLSFEDQAQLRVSEGAERYDIVIYDAEKKAFEDDQAKRIKDIKALITPSIKLAGTILTNNDINSLLTDLITNNFDKIQILQNPNTGTKDKVEFIFNLIKDPRFLNALNDETLKPQLIAVVEKVIDMTMTQAFPSFETQKNKLPDGKRANYTLEMHEAKKREFQNNQEKSIRNTKALLGPSLTFLKNHLNNPDITIVFDEFIKNEYDKIPSIQAGFSKGLFYGLDAILEIVIESKDPVVLTPKDIKSNVENNASSFSRLIKDAALTFAKDALNDYKVDPKIFDLFDILFSNITASSRFMKALQAVTTPDNFSTPEKTEEALEVFVNGLHELLTHPVLGQKVQDFITNNKETLTTIINAVAEKVPVLKSILQQMAEQNITIGNILDQIVHNPDDLLKFFAMAKGAGVLRNKISIKDGISTFVSQLISNSGTGLNSPLAKQVIADKVGGVLPQLLIDITPDWIKAYMPGKGDRRGGDFSKWVVSTINSSHTTNEDLHQKLVNAPKTIPSKDGVNPQINLSEDGYEFVRYKSLAGMDVDKLSLNRYNIEGLKFDNSKIGSLIISGGTTLKDTSFKGVSVKSLTINGATISNCKFDGMQMKHEVMGVFWGKSDLVNPNAKVSIKNIVIDDASLVSLISAAEKGGFKLEFSGTIEVTKSAIKEVEKVSTGDESKNPPKEVILPRAFNELKRLGGQMVIVAKDVKVEEANWRDQYSDKKLISYASNEHRER